MSTPLSPPTLTALLSTVRNMLNQPDSTNSFWTDAELTSYINEGIRVYFADVIQNMEGQWGKAADLNISSGTETIALPSDFYKIKALYKKVSDGYVVLPYQNYIVQSYATQTGLDGTDTYFPTYYLRENNVVLRPVPNYSETAGLRIEYVYFPEELVAGVDVMSSNVAPLFKQVIEMYAVYKAKVKESLVNGVDTSVLAKANLADLYKQFIESVKNRSAYPQFVVPFCPEN